MRYLTQATDIRVQIEQFASKKILWLDTEVADWQTKNPKLSLIQVLDDPTDMTGDRAYILDVLYQPELLAYFINKIMLNSSIEKVFHNASYDLKFLGQQAENITCTFKLAKSISKDILKVSNLKLKTLAVELCHFSNVNSTEQGSDWKRRSLSAKQLHYAAMDTVYLAHVHQHLLKIINYNNPTTVNTLNSPDLSFSATKIRLAFECPRLLYLKQHFGGNTLFLLSNTPNGTGKLFHNLANKFLNSSQEDPKFTALFVSSAEQLQAEKIAVQMQQYFYDLVFYDFLELTVQNDSGKATVMLQLWQELKELIQRWTELLIANRRYCSADTLIRKTFVAQEYKVEYDFTLSNGAQQKVVGEFDSLIFNFDLQRLCVVEYKTYQPVDMAAQLAQVALYSYMLSAKTQKPVDAVVYCVSPELKEYYYSHEQLAETVHQLIPHKLQQMRQWLTWKPEQINPPPPTTQSHLCKICPQQEKCQTFFQNQESQSHETGSEPISTAQTTNTDAIAQQLVTTLQSFKIKVDYLGTVMGSAFIRVKLKPHAGVGVNSILRLSQDLQVQLGLTNPPLINPQAGYISIDLPRRDRAIAKFEQYIQPQASLPTTPVKIAIGVNLEGQLVEADLSDPNTCHFLVGGTTGSGKSEFLRSLLLSLLVRHTPSQLQVALVDPKRVTFPEFERIPWLYAPVVKDGDRAIELIERLVTDMDERYQMFEAARCSDLHSYNQQTSHPLPRIVCIFDEYADLMAENATRTALEQNIKRLGAMARAAGIHLIIATQRPEAKVVTPLIRSNLPARVALRTASEADAKIILAGNETAAYLLGKGDLLYQFGSQMHRLQSLLAENIQLAF
jgi:S-DNA-T family DNA segregation ATPase FtsK/SpoIIIE